MYYCKKCGEKLSDSARFCPNCGKAVYYGGSKEQRQSHSVNSGYLWTIAGSLTTAAYFFIGYVLQGWSWAWIVFLLNFPLVTYFKSKREAHTAESSQKSSDQWSSF